MTAVASRPVVVCLNGSENATGATARVLEQFAASLESRGVDVITIPLATRDVRPCGPCGNCNWRDSLCEVDDDVAEIVRLMTSADGIVYAAPVHGFGLASPLQIFVERAGVGHLRFTRPLADKVGGAIVLGRRYAHTSVVGQLYHNMLLNRMILPGSGYPAVVSTESGDPLADTEGMAAVHALAVRVAEFIHRMRGVVHAGGGLPVNERVL